MCLAARGFGHPTSDTAGSAARDVEAPHRGSFRGASSSGPSDWLPASHGFPAPSALRMDEAVAAQGEIHHHLIISPWRVDRHQLASRRPPFVMASTTSGPARAEAEDLEEALATRHDDPKPYVFTRAEAPFEITHVNPAWVALKKM